MSNPWTPGPWVIRYGGFGEYPYAITAPHVSGHKPGAIRDITRWGAISMPSSPEGQANARLIAAAPEMAEALEMLVDFAKNSPTQDYNEDRVLSWLGVVCAKADTLLARIRGEAP